MLRLPIDQLDSFLTALAAQSPLYLPTEKDGRVDFRRHGEGQPALAAALTENSPKNLFFRQVEPIAHFQTEANTFAVQPSPPDETPFVLFGVRACDMAALDILDGVFLAEPSDTHYAARRKSAIIVALGCQSAAPGCFCGDFGIDAAQPLGDARAWLTKDELLVQPITEKGRALFSSLEETAQTPPAFESPKKGVRSFPGQTDALFGAQLWDSLCRTCLGCGSCTFRCPTCQCYDVRDKEEGAEILRYRCWDSCMYSDFTLMAHGNSRKTQKERFRQRFMHKLVYYPDNNAGRAGCVGCGRCLAGCPSSIGLAKVAQRMEGAIDE